MYGLDGGWTVKFRAFNPKVWINKAALVWKYSFQKNGPEELIYLEN
jgi:hypothetical protein